MTFSYDRTMLDCLLDLKFKEGAGLKAQDFAKPHHPAILTGPPTWAQLASRQNVLDFNPATPDFVEIAQADSVDLDFTTESFSMSAWINPDNIIGNKRLLVRGLLSTDGWDILMVGGLVYARTYQAGALQTTIGTSVVASSWQLITLTRSGNSIIIYLNGINITTTSGSHSNPTTSARKLLVGILDDETTDPFGGMIGRPRIWGRVLDKEEIRQIYQQERHLYGI